MRPTLITILYLCVRFPSRLVSDPVDVASFLLNFNNEAVKEISKHLTELENVLQNFSDENQANVIESNAVLRQWMAEQVNNVSSMLQDNRTTENQKSSLKSIQAMTMLLPTEQWNELMSISLSTLQIYLGICAKSSNQSDCLWESYPKLRREFANCRDQAALLRYWNKWYRANGHSATTLSSFERLVKLYHNGSVSMNYTDLTELWNSKYASEGFQLETWANKSFYQLLPLYEELHAYVRHRLESEADKVTIDAHLLGDLFAESWENVYLTKRTINSSLNLNYTSKLRDKYKTASEMVELCKTYFKTIGFDIEPMLQGEFVWSVDKGGDKKICQPTTLVFPSVQVREQRKDVVDWMSMCADVAMDDLSDMFTLMGRLVYARYYKDQQPVYFQDAPNPGMLDSLGKAVALAFNNPVNLQERGLLDNPANSEELQFEHLYKQALITVPTMMRAFATDTWLRHLVRLLPKTTSVDWPRWNDAWWQTLRNLTGISRPPSTFDIQSVDFLRIPRIATLEPIGRQFFSTAFSYQLFEYFCNSGKQEGKLHQCHIDGRLNAIDEITNILSSGSKSSWSSTIEQISGNGLRIEPLLLYFDPLHKMLIRENDNKSLCRGWGADELWPHDVMSNLSSNRCRVKPPNDGSTTTAEPSTPTVTVIPIGPVVPNSTDSPTVNPIGPVVPNSTDSPTVNPKGDSASMLAVPRCVVCTLSAMALLLSTWHKFSN